MSAQPTNAVHATAAHESAGANRASPAIDTRGVKKHVGLAALFSELLSQAQGNLGLKGSESLTAIPGDFKPLHAPIAKPSRLSSHEGSIPGKTENARGKAPALRRTGGQAVVASIGAKGHPAEVVGKKNEQERHAKLGTAVHNQLESLASKASDAKRRGNNESGGVAEESATILASGATAVGTAVTINANGIRAKTVRPGGDEDPSIEKRDSVKKSVDPKLTVLDLRRSTESRHAALSKVLAAAANTPKDTVIDAKTIKEGGRELYRELSLGAKGAGDTQAFTSPGKPDAVTGKRQGFDSMLADRLREAWNGEIVQSARIVLKDGDAGTIRLRLRPESLGNVKIELNLSENNISGRILVESDEAKSAFERNMNELADAFRQGGFDSARLEVAVGGGSGGDSPRDESREPFYSERLRTVVGSSADPATATSAYARRGGAVDIFA
jgi:flagellar hook-length control protein FliK